MTYGSVSFLFMGDVDADAESRIANSGACIQGVILKVGHHGSATSSSSAFLAKVQMNTPIIEVGPGIHMVPLHQRPMVTRPRRDPRDIAPT